MASLRTLAKTALFTILVPGTVAVAIPRVLARWRPYPRLPIEPSTARLGAAVSTLAGGALYAHTAFRFADEGDGTPAPVDEPEELVTGGVYAYSRNPMYVAVLLVVIGEALRHRSVTILWWAVGCWIGFHNRVIRHEEPHLAAKHGESYDEYREAVPRWVPGIHRRDSDRDQ